MIKKGTNYRVIIILIAAVALAAAIFYLTYRWDNRIGYDNQYANNGELVLNMDMYLEKELVYLLSGWEYYDNLQLSPENVLEYEPDEYIYIGKYGGFERGDENKNPHGCATYRLTILTDDTLREYAMEIPTINTVWTLWINDQEMRGDGEKVSFLAKGKIEIIFAVSDDVGFYSGILQVPAFGSPAKVTEQLSNYSTFHIITSVFAIMLMFICLALAVWRRDKTYALLAVMSLVTAVLLLIPIFKFGGMRSEDRQIAFRISFYTLILLVIFLQGVRLEITPALFYPAIAVSLAVIAVIIIQPNLTYTKANELYMISDILRYFQWIAAIWLLVTCVIAAVRKGENALWQLFIGTVFSTAMFANLIMPYSRPIVTGGSVEIAGVLAAILTTIQMVRDNIKVFRENVVLNANKELGEMQLRYAKTQEQYVEETRAILHEHKNQLTVLWNYSKMGDFNSLNDRLNEILKKEEIDIHTYTKNALINSILSLAEDSAEQADIYFEITSHGIESDLRIEDLDIASLLMNLTDNAIEANRRISNRDNRWIYLSLDYDNNTLQILIMNPTDGMGAASEKYMEKASRFHGYGRGVIKRIIDSYNGDFLTETQDDCYAVSVSLNL